MSLFDLGIIDLFATPKRGRPAKTAAAAPTATPAPVVKKPQPIPKPVSYFTQTGIIIHIRTQRCRCCGNSIDFIDGEFVVEEATHGTLRKSSFAKWTRLNPSHSTLFAHLPRSIHNTAEEVESCATCIKEALWAGQIELSPQPFSLDLQQQSLAFA